MHFLILGPLEVRDGPRVAVLPAFKVRALLAALLCSPGRTAKAEALIDVIWGEQAPKSASENLRLYVFQLRKALGDRRRIVYGPQGYTLAVLPGEVDADQFIELSRQAQDLLARGRAGGAREMLARALALWRGPAFADLAMLPTVAAEVRRLEQQRLATVERRISIDLAEGRHAELVPELVDLARAHPLNEQLCAQLMLALHRAGRRSEALDVFRQTRCTLIDELGIEPGGELQRLQRAVLNGDSLGFSQPATLAVARRSVAVPRQLPPDLVGFAGRSHALAQLDGILTGSRDNSTAPVIALLSGMGGLGKTALAVHWAHRVADRFPDGQLYIDLRGFDPNNAPIDRGEALRAFLDAFGVAPEQIPPGLDAQVGLYRSLLAGRRVLVVLDNARDADQARPLLPGGAGCLALVTSRCRLAGLVAGVAAHPLVLDPLSEAEARQLLTGRLGASRVAAEASTVDSIIERCAGLPLALAIVAARLTTHPTLRLGMLADELRTARIGPSVFASDDPMVDLRAVLSWSYQLLGAEAARLFRLLGIHYGPDITVAAAASLADVTVKHAGLLLAELSDAHLLAEHVPGRYILHDLLRGYAAELADAHDTDVERRQAVYRALDYHLHSAYAASIRLDPHRPRIVLASAQPGAISERFAGRDAALDWLAAEQPVLFAAIAQASDVGCDTHTWQLAWTLVPFFSRRGYWPAWAMTHQATMEATRRIVDLGGQAHAHLALARGYAWVGRYNDSHMHYKAALDRLETLTDKAQLASANLNFAVVLEQQGRYEAALRQAERAADGFRVVGDLAGNARALNAAGWYQAMLGQYQQTLTHCAEALVVLRRVDDPWGEADTLQSLGYAHHRLGHHGDANRCYQQALALYRRLRRRYAEANTLVRLGDSRDAGGDTHSARQAWHQALLILKELGQPEADHVLAKLNRRNFAINGRSGPGIG